MADPLKPNRLGAHWAPLGMLPVYRLSMRPKIARPEQREDHGEEREARDQTAPRPVCR